VIRQSGAPTGRGPDRDPRGAGPDGSVLAFNSGGRGDSRGGPPGAPVAPLAEYLTRAQVAAWLQVSLKTVSRWAADPSMPVLRIGGAVRFPRARLEAWVRRQEQGPGQARRTRNPWASDADALINRGDLTREAP
jgi:excisionase family DNA binding protein